MLVFSALAVAQAVATACLTSLTSTAISNPRADPNITLLHGYPPDVISPLVTSPASPLPPCSIAPLPTLLDYFSVPDPSSCLEGSEWGDSIHIDPKENHRIYFQNIDGLRHDDDEMDLYVSSMAQFKVGTFCWADPGLDLSQVPVRQALQRPLSAHFTSSRSAYSASLLPSTTSSSSSSYQPGGTFMATTDKWTTRSTGKPLCDPSGLGRWSGLCYTGKRGKRLAVLTAYRSPRQAPKGGFGFYDQQYALLLANGVQKPNVRKQFITDLVEYINKLQADGFEIVLSLDANETSGQDQKFGIDHLVEECTLHDLHLAGPSKPPATYKYGHERRIDYMFGSAMVLESLRHAGYLAYDNGIFSKHRGLFVDLDFSTLMGSVENIVPSPARGINSEDQPAVDKYLEAFKKYATDHNIWSRVKDLQTVAPFMTTEQVKEGFDKIDRDVTRAMLHAEKQAKRPKGRFAWSPKLREAGLTARFWHLRKREVDGAKGLAIALKGVLNRLKTLKIVISDANCNDATTVTTYWKEATKMLRTVRDAAYDHRAVHLLAMLTQYQNETFSDDDDHLAEVNKGKIRRIRRLINIENMRKPFRTIHASVSSFHSGGIGKLFVPSHATNKQIAAKFCDPDGSISAEQLIAMAQFDKTSVAYDTLLDCEAIEAELMRYNRNWFRQASETPFGNGELYDLVGYDGLTEEATAIIDGDCIEYMGIPMSRELQVFLEECKRPSTVSDVQPTISRAEFRQAIKGWKETTSTSPSGRHLGHYRTAILDDDVNGLHTDLLNLPISCGFAPERWTHSVTPLIEKDEGTPYLTRLRVIHLFEADYNLFLKMIFGRRMVKNAERSEALNDQQHGSRPRRMTTDALFLSRLEKDIIRQIKANSAHMDNDATGCYDRIVTALGMIACRRLGMPESAIRCQAATLKNMKYAVKHAFGTAFSEYFGTIFEPLFGTGQGSGASPAIWLALVVILLNALDRISAEDGIPGLSFDDPWNELHAAWRVGAFVDDTNQGIMDPTGNFSRVELANHMQAAGQLWEKLLFISGGTLNLSKCSWTMQFWEWTNGRPSMAPVLASDPSLLMTCGNNPEHHIIRRHKNETEVKGLGVHMNFCGTFSGHARTMKVKFDGLARKLSQSTLSSTLSWKYYNTFYLPSVRYSLPVTSMTPAELHKVQSLMTATILNKLGYNRHYPHAVAFAPPAVFGCGLIDLRLEQGLLQIQSLLDYVGTDQKVGRVMLISLRHLQVEAGVSFDILQQPETPLVYLTECWLLSLRRFCAQHNIHLAITANRLPRIARVHDSLLMDMAIQLGLKKQELVDLNLVRIFLQVSALSDITTADGTRIHPWSWRGLRIPDRASNLTFARQETPTSYQIGLWRRLLRAFLVPHANSANLLLNLSLGPWIQPSNMTWGAMIAEGNLYRRDPTINSGERNVSVHFPRVLEEGTKDITSAPVTFYDAKPDWFSATIPVLAAPADLTGDQIFSATYSDLQFPSIPAPAKTFQAWIANLPAAEKRLLSGIQYEACDAEHLILQYLQVPCTLSIGTDGGLRNKNGSLSWILCSPMNEQMLSNSGPVDGWHRCQSSLRSEAAALASITLFLDELLTFAQVELKCTFELFVDSTSAISNVTIIRDLIPKRRFANNADILSTIRSAPQVVQKFQLRHVKSHQDDKVPFEELPFPVQLNVWCDTLATNQLLLQATDESVRTLSNPLTPRNLSIQVVHGSQVISSHYISRLRTAIGLEGHRRYLQTKYKWTDAIWDSIAWDALSACARRPVLTNSSNRSKLVHNWLNLGKQRAQHGNGEPLQSQLEWCCPYCRTPEDFRHLVTCPDPRAQTSRYKAMMVLRKSFGSTQGAAALMLAIKTWTLDPTTTVNVSCGSLSFKSAIDRAVKSQSDIGWENVFRGLISEDWGQIYSATNSTAPEARRTDGKTFLTKAIQALQEYSLVIWKHRNEVLHAAGSSGLDIVHAALNQSIRQLYSIRSSLSPILQSYFNLPLADRLKTSPRHRKRWLRLAQLASSHASATGSQQSLLPTYFQYAPSQERVSCPDPVSTGECPTVPAILQQATITTYFAPCDATVT